MNAGRDQYLERLGLVRWERRTPAGEAEPALNEPVAETTKPLDVSPVDAHISAEPAVPEPSEDGSPSRVQECTACELHAGQSPTGVDRRVEWMVIGDATEAEEEGSGEPFAGEVGKLLDKMLLASGYKRNDVFVAEYVKCRPIGGEPGPEVNACAEFLRGKINGIKPKLILCMGRIAAQSLLASDAPTESLRGKVRRYADTGIPVIVTYHPSELLRQPSEKRKAWQDLKLAMRTTGKDSGA